MKKNYVTPVNKMYEISVKDGVLTTGSPKSVSYAGPNTSDTAPKTADTHEWRGNSSLWDSEW